jgi:hypothetical protein
VITGTGVNVEYRHDALGRRIVKIVKDPDGESVTRYVHDGFQVIEERDDIDDVQYRYTYGNGIDERLEMEKNIDGTFKRFFLLHDSIGNVIGLTNDRGHLIERYNYTPFGEVTLSLANIPSGHKLDEILSQLSEFWQFGFIFRCKNRKFFL